MDNKDLELQQKCHIVVHELEDAIAKIKAACVEPDLDTAEKFFHDTVIALMDNVAHVILHGATWTDIEASIKAGVAF